MPQAQRRHAADVKTIYARHHTYRTAYARDEQSGAVQARARAVTGEYLDHARVLDRKHNANGQGGRSPTACETRVQGWGTIRGLVFGNYAEASPDVHDLLGIAAKRLADKHYGLLGARSAAEAKSHYIGLLRRRLGFFVAREFARHRLSRMPYVGQHRTVVEASMRAGRGARPPAEGRRIEHAHELFFAHQAYHAGALAARA
jgi:hypothetical protein